MDFELPPHVIEFRNTVKRIIRDVVTPEMIDEMHRSGTFNNYALNRALAKEGLLERAVPGMGMGDPLELWVLFNELEKSGAPYDGMSTSVMVAGVVQQVGTEAQKQAMIPTVTSGDSAGVHGLQRARLRQRCRVDRHHARCATATSS